MGAVCIHWHGRIDQIIESFDGLIRPACFGKQPSSKLRLDVLEFYFGGLGRNLVKVLFSIDGNR